MEKNFIQSMVFEDITPYLACKFIENNRNLDEYKSDKGGCLNINSRGGDVFACFSMVEQIEKLKKPINTHVSGMAFSCAFILAISGRNRTCYKHSSYMIHSIGRSYNNYTARESFQYLGGLTESFQNMENSWRSIILQKTKIGKRKLESMLGKGDWYMTPKEALELGVVDKIV